MEQILMDPISSNLDIEIQASVAIHAVRHTTAIHHARTAIKRWAFAPEAPILDVALDANRTPSLVALSLAQLVAQLVAWMPCRSGQCGGEWSEWMLHCQPTNDRNPLQL